MHPDGHDAGHGLRLDAAGICDAMEYLIATARAELRRTREIGQVLHGACRRT